MFESEIHIKVAEFHKMGSVCFYPGGMGTGYIVSKLRTPRYCRVFTAKEKTVLGLSAGWVDVFDFD